jgi:hypothetical protein
MLTKWHGNYEILEEHHGYIQWLFPIYLTGQNWAAQALQDHEAAVFLGHPLCRQRFLKAYKMMLEFWGMILVNDDTGEVKRHQQWQSRYENLNDKPHNNLRITRVLECLGNLFHFTIIYSLNGSPDRWFFRVYWTK